MNLTSVKGLRMKKGDKLTNRHNGAEVTILLVDTTTVLIFSECGLYVPNISYRLKKKWISKEEIGEDKLFVPQQPKGSDNGSK